jgi:hypothetical protein
MNFKQFCVFYNNSRHKFTPFEPATSCMPCRRATVTPGAQTFINSPILFRLIHNIMLDLPLRVYGLAHIFSLIMLAYIASSPSPSSSSAFSITTFMCASKDTILPLMFMFPFSLISTCCPGPCLASQMVFHLRIYYTNKMIINRGSSFYNLQSRKSKIYTIRFYRLPAKQQIKIHKYLMGCIDL